MVSLLLCITILIGVFLICSDLFITAKGKVSKAVSKNKFNKKSSITIALENYISNFISITDENEKKLTLAFSIIGISKDPKEYKVEVIAQCIVIIIASLFLSIIISTSDPSALILFPIGFLMAVIYHNDKYNKIQKNASSVRLGIEKELSNFCMVINSKLIHTNNIENILSAYYPIASSSMKNQLDVTIADIKTSNVQNALLNFEKRIYSPMLSDVIRGLISVSNGSDMRMYFESKSQEFKQVYKNIIIREVMKRPHTITPLQVAIVLCAIAIIGYPMLTYITTNIGTF